MEDGMGQAADHERIWRGKSLRQARERRRTLDRGVSGQPLPAPDQYAEKDPIAGGPIALGADGFPFAAPLAAWHPGLLQPQGTGFESRGTQAGVLRVAEVLSR